MPDVALTPEFLNRLMSNLYVNEVSEEKNDENDSLLPVEIPDSRPGSGRKKKKRKRRKRQGTLTAGDDRGFDLSKGSSINKMKEATRSPDVHFSESTKLDTIMSKADLTSETSNVLVSIYDTKCGGYPIGVSDSVETNDLNYGRLSVEIADVRPNSVKKKKSRKKRNRKVEAPEGSDRRFGLSKCSASVDGIMLEVDIMTESLDKRNSPSKSKEKMNTGLSHNQLEQCPTNFSLSEGNLVIKAIAEADPALESSKKLSLSLDTKVERSHADGFGSEKTKEDNVATVTADSRSGSGKKRKRKKRRRLCNAPEGDARSCGLSEGSLMNNILLEADQTLESLDKKCSVLEGKEKLNMPLYCCRVQQEEVKETKKEEVTRLSDVCLSESPKINKVVLDTDLTAELSNKLVSSSGMALEHSVIEVHCSERKNRDNGSLLVAEIPETGTSSGQKRKRRRRGKKKAKTPEDACRGTTLLEAGPTPEFPNEICSSQESKGIRNVDSSCKHLKKENDVTQSQKKVPRSSGVHFSNGMLINKAMSMADPAPNYSNELMPRFDSKIGNVHIEVRVLEKMNDVNSSSLPEGITDAKPSSGKKRKRRKRKSQGNANEVNKAADDEVECPSEKKIISSVGISAVPVNSFGNSRRKLLILDLNGVLVDVGSYGAKGLIPDFVVSRKPVYKRPYCEDFLKFCFERFEVAIWSSRIRKNLRSAVKYLFHCDQHRLLFCWDRARCTKTGFFTLEEKKKPLVLKELHRLWKMLKGDYNESNTLLVDDSPYKAMRNPAYTAIFPHPFQYTDTEDRSLGRGGDLRVYLEGLAEAENVQKYVEQNPFGQQPITESHPSWDFYRVIKYGDGEMRPDDNKRVSSDAKDGVISN